MTPLSAWKTAGRIGQCKYAVRRAGDNPYLSSLLGKRESCSMALLESLKLTSCFDNTRMNEFDNTRMKVCIHWHCGIHCRSVSTVHTGEMLWRCVNVIHSGVYVCVFMWYCAFAPFLFDSTEEPWRKHALSKWWVAHQRWASRPSLEQYVQDWERWEASGREALLETAHSFSDSRPQL